MLRHLLNYTVRNCCNIGTCQSTICYVDWISYAGCNNLCLNIMYSKDFCDVTNQVDTRLGNIIQTS